jgi:hypothetical protein
MSKDTITVTMTRTQAALIRQILGDAANENAQLAGKALAEFHGSESWKEANASYYRKRAHTARWLRMKLARAKDLRRKYIDLSAEQFPMSR